MTRTIEIATKHESGSISARRARIMSALRSELERAGSPERARFLEQLIAGLSVVDIEMIPDDRAGYGSIVTARDVDGGEDVSYTLMTGDLVDVDAGQVSLGSPIGQALLGRAAGDETTVRTPQGIRRFLVLDVETLPRSLGLEEEPAHATRFAS